MPYFPNFWVVVNIDNNYSLVTQSRPHNEDGYWEVRDMTGNKKRPTGAATPDRAGKDKGRAASKDVSYL